MSLCFNPAARGFLEEIVTVSDSSRVTIGPGGRRLLFIGNAHKNSLKPGTYVDGYPYIERIDGHPFSFPLPMTFGRETEVPFGCIGQQQGSRVEGNVSVYLDIDAALKACTTPSEPDFSPP